jgi:hypothetical protein
MRFSNSSNADRYTPLQQARVVDRIACSDTPNPMVSLFIQSARTDGL